MITLERGALFLIASLFLINLVSANIIISPTKSVYNVGDAFDITMDVKPTKDTKDFFVAAFVCQGRAVEIYKTPMSLKVGEEKNIAISTTLDNFIVGGINGDCFIRADYGEETTTGKTFTITGNIDVSFDVEATSYNPGNDMKITGRAVKSNGEALNGFVEVIINELGYSSTTSVENGDFNITLQIPADATAGSFQVQVRAYQSESNGEITNEGKNSGIVKVNQILKKVEIALGSESIMPENKLSYSVAAYDQSGQNIATDASVSLISSLGEEIEKKLVKTGESAEFSIQPDYAPGSWNVYAKVESIETRRKFVVEEFEKVSFSLEDQILTITNVGNVVFSGPVEVTIGGINEIKEIENLGVGETKQFKLVAPDGEYEIQVNDGAEKQTLGNVILTGNAVSVNDIGGSLNNTFILVLIILIALIVLGFVIYFYRKKKKQAFIGKTSGSFTPSKLISKFESGEKENNEKADIVGEGTKQESSVIALSIKNMEELSGTDGIKIIDSALWKAKENGAKIYSDGNFRIVVIAPVLSKERDVVLKGLKIAEDIERTLTIYNRRSARKVDFGIGLNVGELIVDSSKEGKFKFISIDNTISAAKKMAIGSDKEALFSEKIRRKTVGKIKAKKIEGTESWKLEKVTDRSEHVDYINRFKEKQNFKS